MPFLYNSWYAAGWSADLERQLLARTIVGRPIVLYRTVAGEVVALLDTCPHRFAALSLGKIVGDGIECPYHGLRFDRGGACVHNPHGPFIPPTAFVRSFPVIECDGLIWVWMGNADEADQNKVTRFPELCHPERYTYTRGQTMQMPLSYELITDNLMDLSHVDFIHADSLGSDCLVPGQIATRREGDAIWSERMGTNGTAPRAFWASRGCKQDDRVDYWTDIRWTAPANFYLYGGVTAPGRPREEGAEISSVQILTPASDQHTYYFFQHFRNYERDDDEMTAVIAKAAFDAFANEDEPIIARVMENMRGRGFWEMKPTILPCDDAAIRVRRTREKMIRDEARSFEPATSIQKTETIEPTFSYPTNDCDESVGAQVRQ